MWCTNRDDKDKPVCQVCYKRQVCHARRPNASVFPSSLYRHILTQYPRCSFPQLAASRGTCSGCGTDGGNTSNLTRSKLKKHAWYCEPCIYREVRISGFFFSLSFCSGDIRRHDDFRDKLFRLNSRHSSSIFFAGAGHRNRRGDDVREVRDGNNQKVAQLQR